MKALSIRQPWAWAILYLGKRVENRTWRTRFQGKIYIHAGLRFDKDALEDLEADIQRIPQEQREPCHLGALVVGTAFVVDCVEPDDVPRGQEVWAVGPWCFILEDVTPLEKPIPCKGALGFFEVASPIERAIQ
jgi:hypothetical protein